MEVFLILVFLALLLAVMLKCVWKVLKPDFEELVDAAENLDNAARDVIADQERKTALLRGSRQEAMEFVETTDISPSDLEAVAETIFELDELIAQRDWLLETIRTYKQPRMGDMSAVRQAISDLKLLDSEILRNARRLSAIYSVYDRNTE